MNRLAALTAILALAGSQAWALPSTGGVSARGLTLFSPAVEQTSAGARVEGAVCRLGPTPTVAIGELSIERLGADGQAVERQRARVAPVLRDRGPTCAYYHVQTAWAATDPVQVCLTSTAGADRVCAPRLK